MTDQKMTEKEALALVNNFISKVKVLKRRFQKENDHFDKKGIVGFNKGQSQIFSTVDEISDLYTKIDSKDIFTSLNKAKIETLQKEHEEFREAIKEYSINVRAGARVGEIFMNVAKDSVENNTKMDLGYSKDSALMSEKRMINNMPSVAVNNKV